MNEILQGRGLVEIAEGRILVTGLKGPLEDGWQEKVKAFVTQIRAAEGSDPGAGALDTLYPPGV